jgi:predicted metalloprotease with PDZ domain
MSALKKLNLMKAHAKVLLGLLANFVLFISYSQIGDIPSSRYHLKMSEEKLREVEVSATLTLQEPFLEMLPWGFPPELERGWTTFVDIQSITDQQGRPIAFEWNRMLKKWALEVNENTVVHLSYRVELSHDDHNWDAGGGIDGRPTLWEDNTIFWTTSALFIYSGDYGNTTSEVIFELPHKWKVSTAWVPISENTFLAKNTHELAFNLLMIGQHHEELLSHDNMSITIATPANFEHRIGLIRQSLEKILPAYKTIFGELPTANYLVCASKNSVQDGEAYTNSFHQMFHDSNLEYNKMVWANTMAHEMFHYWNGTNFIYSEDYEGNYWFSEGFTNYYSSLTLVRAGIIEEEDYLRFLAFQFSKMQYYQANTENPVSLTLAGKSKVNNWHFIYGGGTSIAFILDVEIRKATNGQKSLDDFMKVLYTKYGKSGRPISLEIQITELNYMTNSDFRPFFDQYVSGTEAALAAIIDACEEAGLVLSNFQNEIYLTPKKQRSQSIFRSMLKPL